MTDGLSATLPRSAPILKRYSLHSADRHGAAGGPDDMPRAGEAIAIGRLDVRIPAWILTNPNLSCQLSPTKWLLSPV